MGRKIDIHQQQAQFWDITVHVDGGSDLQLAAAVQHLKLETTTEY